MPAADSEPGLKRCIAMKSFQIERRTAADEAWRGGPNRAKRFCCQRCRGVGVLLVDTGEVSAHRYVTSRSRLYVQYSGTRKKLLREAFVMDEVRATPTSVFVGQGCVQHASSEWRRRHCDRYHSYLMPKTHGLPDAVAFAYEDAIVLGSQRPWFLHREVSTNMGGIRMGMG